MNGPLSFFLIGLLASLLIVSIARLGSTHADSRSNEIIHQETSGLKAKLPSSSDVENALKQKELQIAEEAKRIAEERSRLKQTEAEVAAKVDELIKHQKQIEEDRAKQKIAEEQTLKKLVKTLQNMKPKKAAEVVTIMEDKLAVQVFLEMKEKDVAKIMDVMDSNRAMVLSSLMAKAKTVGAGRGVAGSATEKK